MSLDKADVEELVNQSLHIAVVKQSIFNISVKALTRVKVKVEYSLLMGIINGISLERLTNILAVSENEEKYTKILEDTVKSVMKLYLTKTSRNHFRQLAQKNRRI